MTTLIVQPAPQRSTQYSSLTNYLAPYEIQLSSLGKNLQSIETIELGGQKYFKCELDSELAEKQLEDLGLLAMSNACFKLYDKIGDIEGPLLRPINTSFSPQFPPDLATTRRYQGKTNEMLTHFMCNIAKFSSEFANIPWSELRVFDPLAGGGTTLFIALLLGAKVAGVEQNKKSAHSTAVFIKQYMQEQRIACSCKEERLKKLRASRWLFSLGDNSDTNCTLIKGEISQSPQLLTGFKKPHFIIADLPYGIQHKGGSLDMLEEALPIWNNLLMPGGALVYSWDATRFSRDQMIKIIESTTALSVLSDSPYDSFGHRVDRVIKNREIIVATNKIEN